MICRCWDHLNHFSGFAHRWYFFHFLYFTSPFFFLFFSLASAIVGLVHALYKNVSFMQLDSSGKRLALRFANHGQLESGAQAAPRHPVAHLPRHLFWLVALITITAHLWRRPGLPGMSRHSSRKPPGCG